MRRALSKAIFWLSGRLAYVKTPQRFYTLPKGDRTFELNFEYAGWHWCSCGLSGRLMELSERIDPEHWDHWALVHEDCDADYCAECGGKSCWGIACSDEQPEVRA